MAVVRDKTRHAPPPEPCAEPVDQAVELGRIIAAAKPDLLFRARLGGEHRQPCEIEAEAWIDLITERGETLDEQRADRLRIAHRPRGTRRDAFHRTIGAEQQQLDAAGAFTAGHEHRLEACSQPLDGGEHVLLPRDRLGETLLGKIGRDRQPWTEWFVGAAERVVEPGEKVVAEAGGERRARQVDDVADALETKARQRRDRIIRQPQRGERQRRDGVALAAGRNDVGGTEARHRPGGADGAGDGDTRRKAEVGQACQQIVAQCGFAAEQMRAAADVEQDAVGRIDGNKRRVAQAPIGDGVEKTRIGGRILRHGDERGMHGARLRERQTGAQAEPLCRRIDRGQQIEHCRACRRRREELLR